MAKIADPFYKNKRWQRKREVVLRKNEYLCKESKQYGRHVAAEVVHHIYPRDKYPELAYEEWNLLPVTNKIHNTFHDRENDEVIGRGLYWQQKRKREFDKFYNTPPKNNQIF